MLMNKSSCRTLGHRSLFEGQDGISDYSLEVCTSCVYQNFVYLHVEHNFCLVFHILGGGGNEPICSLRPSLYATIRPLHTLFLLLIVIV